MSINTVSIKIYLWAALVFALLAVSLAAAAESTPTPNNRAFFGGLQQRLIADGFDAERIKTLYQNEQVFFESQGVALYFQHNEATIDYDRLTKPPWIREAEGYMRAHTDALQRSKRNFGVDPRVITAIILVETQFGRYVGKRSILNTLSTMAVLGDAEPREFLWSQLPEDRRVERSQYDQKADQKAAWAYSELKAFLTYTAQHQIDPVSVLGSYAGALGIAQFMPSNILAYGADGNGDGRIDLFEDADAIASIASYLKHYGWKPRQNREAAYKVIYNYNHSSYYVNTILKIAEQLQDG